MSRAVLIPISLGVILFFLLLAPALLSRKKTDRPRAPQPVVRNAPTMGISQPENVVFTFSSAPPIPASLPVYVTQNYTRSRLEKLIQGVADDYAISSSPSSLFRSGLFTETWLSDGVEISLAEQGPTSTILFRQYRALRAPSPAVSPAETARSFVSQLFSFPSPIRLTETGSTKNVPEGLLILDSSLPSYIETVLFSYVIDTYPIISPPHAEAPVSVIVDSYGIVRASTVLPPPLTIARAGSVSLLSSEGILTNLSLQKGSIINAGKATENDVSGLVSFSSFIIDKTSVVYAYSGDTLTPAFLLHGFGSNNQGGHQEATFFLWAAAW